MKNNESQELKPIYIHETGYSTDDEINMVDLVKTLFKHKTLIAVIFTIIIALGVIVALFTPRIYTFSSTIEIGSQIINGLIQPLESPQALLAKLQYSYIPQILVERRQSSPNDKTKYQIKSSAPKDGNITLLEIKGTEDQADILVNLLQAVSQKAIQDHSRIFTSVKSDLDTRLNQAVNTLNSLKNVSNNKTEIAINTNTIEKLKSQLSNLRNTREIQPPIKSIDPTGGSRKIIVVIFAFAGIFLGVFAAFFTEFLSKVKKKIDEDDKK